MMYYILRQLETNGYGASRLFKGEVWSTSFTSAFWKQHPDDSLEKFCEREKVEIVKKVRSYAELSREMEKL